MARASAHKEPSARPSAAHDVVTLVDDVLAKAVAAGASDIHFEPTAKEMLVKFRLDGLLETVERLPSLLSEKVVARLKVLGGLLTYRNDVPQEGRIMLRAAGDGKVLDRRLAVFPTVHGQRAVVRLFYEESALTELEKLGLPAEILSALKTIAAGAQGVLLLTGPAGSGKSTTLAALLRHIVRQFAGKSVVTLEDPVERHVEGVTQVQVTPQMTFPVALRSLLRQDPEVLMLGEIRDAQTAAIAVEAGLTGHLLLSTLHSGTGAGALLRLLDMGLEPYQLVSSVRAVVSQRLLRRLCEHCKRAESGGGALAAVGCPECLGTGYKGRTLIAEMVRVDEPVRNALLAKADLQTLSKVAGDGGQATLLAHGRRLVTEGVTTRQELERVCQATET